MTTHTHSRTHDARKKNTCTAHRSLAVVWMCTLRADLYLLCRFGWVEDPENREKQGEVLISEVGGEKLQVENCRELWYIRMYDNMYLKSLDLRI